MFNLAMWTDIYIYFDKTRNVVGIKALPIKTLVHLVCAHET